jgi:hypothetical protein
MNEFRPLMMRSNRLLGASLVEHSLIKIEVLEQANERLLELMSSAEDMPVSILQILIVEKKALNEQQILNFLSEEMGLGVVDLANYDQPDEIRKRLELGACWATWTVPFDIEEGVNFVASAFYLSPAVRSYWEAELTGPIQWYATTTENISDFLSKLQLDRENMAAGEKAAN